MDLDKQVRFALEQDVEILEGIAGYKMPEYFTLESGGKVQPVTRVILDGARINSQTPIGEVSTNKQMSGWIAMTADGKMFDELHHEWSLVPKDLILDIRLTLNNPNIVLPKIESFTKFLYIKRGDGKYIGVGAMIKNSTKAMYVLALNQNEGTIVTIDEITDIERLPSVSSIEYVDLDSIEGNHISIDIPFKMLILPRRGFDHYFFQYKDGAIHMIGGPSELYGQVVGMTMNHIGNCIVIYYDQPSNRCLVSIDNLFAMKVSPKAQSIPSGVLMNPITGNIV
jgi:hypothetical protein